MSEILTTFRQFWTQTVIGSFVGPIRLPSAIARLFREISIRALSDLGRIWGQDPKNVQKRPKMAKFRPRTKKFDLGPSNFDPWDQKKSPTKFRTSKFWPLRPKIQNPTPNFDPTLGPWPPQTPARPSAAFCWAFPQSRQTLLDPDPKWPKCPSPKIVQNGQKLTLQAMKPSVKFLAPKWPSRPDPDQNPRHRAIFWEVLIWPKFFGFWAGS